MWVFNLVVGKLFALIFWPIRGLGPWPAMIVVSFLTGLLMLFIFRAASNQEGILKAKNRIKAHLLELRLYKDSLSQQMKSQGRILTANGRYIGYAFKPMLIMIVPIMLILIQLNLWFGSMPLRTGESALVKIKFAEGTDPLKADMSLEAPAGIAVETPPLRIEEEREIDWRVRARADGIHPLVFRSGGETFTLAAAVSQDRLIRIAALKPGPNLVDQIFNPGDEPIPKSAGVTAAEIAYPPRRMNLFGWRMHWLVAYFALSIIFGFAFKGVFKVEI